MIFRIYIPALEADGVSMTIDVEAENWMMALRAGLDEVGADPDIVKRAICDIKADKTIHVMEPAQGRVFVLRELNRHPTTPPPAADPYAGRDIPVGEVIAEPATPAGRIRARPNTRPASATSLPVSPPAPEPPDDGPLRHITAEVPAWATESTEEVPWVEDAESAADKPSAARRDTAPFQNLVVRDAAGVLTSAPDMDAIDYSLDEADLEKYFRDPDAPPTRQISHLDIDSMVRDDPRVMARTPSEEIPTELRARLRDAERESEELFAQVFEEMAEIDMVAGDEVEEGLSFALELAVKRIPSEAGWLLLADMNRRDLYFATATGPRAEEVIDYRLPMGKGIAGFCAVNGVSMALSDVERDPRFQLSISKSIGYRIDSVACAPVQHEGRVFGAIQIMNHQARAEYTPAELDILNYIARRTAEFLALHVS